MTTKPKFKFINSYTDMLVWTLVEGTTKYGHRFMGPGDSIAFPRHDFWRKHAESE